ncbi:Hypothetical predicted protein [Lecanosticta acicola]|uniref:Uncharacterized protein n=1 Tax=Lecanosticta acicola TaxID=111012 RepID=A0AAI8Z5N2_9PEZI|nr:Hypothetical predicted protein [Lecanosticta acicola]
MDSRRQDGRPRASRNYLQYTSLDESSLGIPRPPGLSPAERVQLEERYSAMQQDLDRLRHAEELVRRSERRRHWEAVARRNEERLQEYQEAKPGFWKDFEAALNVWSEDQDVDTARAYQEFKAHESNARAASYSEVRFVGMLMWFRRKPQKVATALRDLCKYLHGEATCMWLVVLAQDKSDEIYGLRKWGPEIHHAASNTKMNQQLWDNEEGHYTKIEVMGFVPFGTGRDFKSIRSLASYSEEPVFNFSVAKQLEMIRGGLEARKILLKPGAEPRWQPGRSYDDFVDCKMMEYTVRALQFLDKPMGSWMTWSNKQSDHELYGNVCREFKEYAASNNFDKIFEARQKVPQWRKEVARYQRLQSSIDDEEDDDDDDEDDYVDDVDDVEDVVAEEIATLHEKLEEQVSEFFAFEGEFGEGVLGMEWKDIAAAL